MYALIRWRANSKINTPFNISKNIVTTKVHLDRIIFLKVILVTSQYILLRINFSKSIYICIFANNNYHQKEKNEST